VSAVTELAPSRARSFPPTAAAAACRAVTRVVVASSHLLRTVEQWRPCAGPGRRRLVTAWDL